MHHSKVSGCSLAKNVNEKSKEETKKMMKADAYLKRFSLTLELLDDGCKSLWIHSIFY